MRNYFDLFGIRNLSTIDELFDSYLNELGKSDPEEFAFVAEDGSFVWEFKLPGYSKEDIEISFFDDYLTISSNTEKKDDRKFAARKKFSMKKACPNYKFKIDETKAELKDGILKITIPPKEKKEEIIISIS
jgi:HSP20 family protein